jgi:hypothetical protein
MVRRLLVPCTLLAALVLLSGSHREPDEQGSLCPLVCEDGFKRDVSGQSSGGPSDKRKTPREGAWR